MERKASSRGKKDREDHQSASEPILGKDNIVDQRLITARIIEGKPHHNVIYSAATGKDGKIYLGLSAEQDQPGISAQLICYDPDADQFADIADLGKIMPPPAGSLRHPHSKIHTAICIGDEGKVFAATHMTAPPAGEDFYHYWHVYNDASRCFEGSRLIIYDPKTKGVEDFGVVSPKGGCRWLTYNPDREELYLTSFLKAHFIVVKIKTGEVKDLGRISQYDFMGPCYSACGYAYTTDCQGFLLRYSPKEEKLEKLPLQIPNASWRTNDGNGVWHFIAGPDKVKLYGVSAIGQRVFEFDPTIGKYGQIRDYGTLYGEDKMGAYSLDVPLGRTMAVGQNGTLYFGTKNYVSGQPGSHIAAIDIQSGTKTYYGRMQVEGLAQISTPVAATVGHNGDVYFGSEQPGKQNPLQLIIFNPAGIKKKLPAQIKERYREVPSSPLSPFLSSYHFPTVTQNSVFVTRGTFYAQELGVSGRTPLIPRNECAITALTMGDHGALFGATSGKRSHLFLYLPLTKRFIPLNTFGVGESVCRSMVADRQGRIYFGTIPATGSDQAGRLYLYDAFAKDLLIQSLDDRDKGEFCLLFKPPSAELAGIEDLGVAVPGDGIGCMTIDVDQKKIYGLSHHSGRFFIYDLEKRKMTVKEVTIDPVKKHSNVSRAILCAGGNVYFSGQHGTLIAYMPQEDVFRKTSMKIPVSPGREYLNTVSALALADDGIVYGGTYADGYLFAFDPKDEQLISLGKPANESYIRSLTVGHDGILWGLCGSNDELVHLVRYDPRKRDLSDLGMMRAKIPKTWVAHQADVLITGNNGELFIGESDALSHLLIYCPPIEKR
jgi:outer membrane protein assembly factor BamB